jgi:lipoprotein-anchoring transpeptidase ErfK/SrfK
MRSLVTAWMIFAAGLGVACAQEKQDRKAPARLDRQAIETADPSSWRKAQEPAAAIVKIQILLDRQHASPGVIDGRRGENLQKAFATFTAAHDLPQAGDPDDAFWPALTENQTEPVLSAYEITAKDLAYKFTPDLPRDYGKLARLPHLNFQTVKEMLAERFHMDERLLDALNPGADFDKAGARILVANVEARTPVTGKIASIDVDKSAGRVIARDKQGALVVAYPATVGSDDMPSPSGDYTVKGVAWSPKYSYDPEKNFQQGRNTRKLTLPSGPNNPVGSVYIALSKPTYGIHGSPDPAKIDKTSSHGCVRLTNWDAEELAHMVRKGVPVHFVEANSG